MDRTNTFRENYASWLAPSAWIPRFPPQVWLKTSSDALEQAEKNILTDIWDRIEHKFVTVHNNSKHIRTVTLNKDAKKTPIVMLHGMGSGVGLWVLNYESLCRSRTVHAFDMLGFGRSSRPKFSTDSEGAEREFVECIEEWRKAMELEKFVLLGHSMGGYLAAAYALKYPANIRHLILVDPWGFPERPVDQDTKKFQIPWYIKGIAYMLKPFNPLAGLRILGPWGPGVINNLRPDIIKKYAHLYDDDTVAQYIYHCNAQIPSGEAAFHSLSEAFGWAKNPMVRRIADIESHVPITMIYGSRSWMDSNMGWQVKFKRPNSYVDIHVVKGAGHHVYADRAADFNSLVNRICDVVDQEFDLVTQSPLGAYKRLRRYSETADSQGGARGMRRRTMSESPPDKLEGHSFSLRSNQTYTGLDRFAEESERDQAETAESGRRDRDTQTAEEEQKPVTFSLPQDS